MKTKQYLNGREAPDRSETITGRLSGRTIRVPDTRSGYPFATLRVHGSDETEEFARGVGYPDTCNFRLTIGVLVPATNCTVESELWSIRGRNGDALRGVGFKTANVLTPSPNFGNAEELAEYERLFKENVAAAVKTAQFGEPHALILGFSMEHFHSDLEQNAAVPRAIEEFSGLSVTSWAVAVDAALKRFDANRIGVLCPFDDTGLRNAVGFFKALDCEVLGAAGLGCASGTDVGHVPDFYKESVIRQNLMVEGVEAVVVCGTNTASLELAEKLEAEVGIPVIGINQTLLWYTLREFGINAPLHGATRLLREF